MQKIFLIPVLLLISLPLSGQSTVEGAIKDFNVSVVSNKYDSFKFRIKFYDMK